MSEIKLIVKKPIITESTTFLKETVNRYIFKVDINANKRQIKEAVEKLFDVHVKDVRTAIYRGKRSVVMNRRGRFEGKKANWKKAYVTLQEGESIDIFEVV